MTIRIVELTGPHSRPVFLNINYIVALRPDASGSGTVILLAQAGSVSREQTVREEVDEVLRRIDEFNAKPLLATTAPEPVP